MYVTLDHVEGAATNIFTFWLKPVRPVRYDAGQFIEMYIPHDNADNRGQKHWFTLSSSPSEELLSITTKFALENGSTFKQTLRGLRPGDQIMLSDPMGDFVLPKDTTIPLVFVAGGIGVTPMRSMIKWLHHKQEQRPITLFYAANKPDEIAFGDLFAQYLGERFIPVVREAKSGYVGEIGTVDASLILNHLSDVEEALFYLSGPEPMIEAIVKDLKAQGVDRHRIVTDYFPGYPAA